MSTRVTGFGVMMCLTGLGVSLTLLSVSSNIAVGRFVHEAPAIAIAPASLRPWAIL